MVPKRILIVDDSVTWREYLKYLFSQDPFFEVVGTAVDGLDAIEKARLLKPDVITMDLAMPRLDGIEACRRILEFLPVPIVIVSDFWETETVQRAFHAMEIGAVAGIQKPKMLRKNEGKAEVKHLLKLVKLMSEIPIVCRTHSKKNIGGVDEIPSTNVLTKFLSGRTFDVVAIGASTGGPVVLKKILSVLPKDYSLPVLVVQHISIGFLEGMVQWLRRVCKIPIRIARNGEPIEDGVVYFAPDNTHMEVDRNKTIRLLKGPAEHGVMPSVSVLFRSLNIVYGSRAVAVLLTGMGKDGAQELLELKRAGALTIVQNKESCLVFGMPGEAVRLGAAVCTASPPEISKILSNLNRKRSFQQRFDK